MCCQRQQADAHGALRTPLWAHWNDLDHLLPPLHRSQWLLGPGQGVRDLAALAAATWASVTGHPISGGRWADRGPATLGRHRLPHGPQVRCHWHVNLTGDAHSVEHSELKRLSATNRALLLSLLDVASPPGDSASVRHSFCPPADCFSKLLDACRRRPSGCPTAYYRRVGATQMLAQPRGCRSATRTIKPLPSTRMNPRTTLQQTVRKPRTPASQQLH